MIKSLRLACLLIIVASPASAWWDKGHKIVCEIAWQELDDSTRDAISNVLRDEQRTFSDSCLWADEIRRDRTWNHVKPHHYINAPSSADSIDIDRDCPPARGCVVRAIDAHVATLNKPWDQTTEVERAQALKFLGHFIGDIHQPLHAGFPNDRGGNGIRVDLFGRSTNLHKVWDGEIIDRSGEPWEQIPARARRRARLLRHAPADARA